MKWRDLTPEQLHSLATDLFDDAHDDEVDREFIIEERGFDAVAATEAVGRFLQREATRRERKAGTCSAIASFPERAIDVHRVGDAWLTIFTVGTQHFCLARVDGDEAQAHCIFIGRMFHKAMGALGVDVCCHGFDPTEAL